MQRALLSAMTTPATNDKAILRQQMRTRLGNLSAAERTGLSEGLGSLILTQDAWLSARTILLFAPLPDEPDVWPLAKAALAEGKNLVLPSFDATSNQYEARRVIDLAADVVTGKFGIREPAPHCPTVPLKQLDLALVPGVAFAASGRRLGRGKGFYDRLLPKIPGIRCGVAYDFQVVDGVPAESHDVDLDCILTPTRWLVVTPRAA